MIPIGQHCSTATFGTDNEKCDACRKLGDVWELAVAGYVDKARSIIARHLPQVEKIWDREWGLLSGFAVRRRIRYPDCILEDQFGPEITVSHWSSARVRSEHLPMVRIAVVYPDAAFPDIEAGEVQANAGR